MEANFISANSDVPGGYYDGFKWTNILGDMNEKKVVLSEVEIHKVDFE